MSSLIRKLFCVLTLILLCHAAAAGTHTWSGASGGVWSAAGNWTGGVPTTGEVGGTIVVFNTSITSTMDIVGLVVDQIHFTGSGNVINGNTPLGISGSVIIFNIVDDTGGNSIGASCPLVLSGLPCDINVAGGALTLAGNISGSTGIIINSVGTLNYTMSANSYTGTTSVASGTLQLNSPGIDTAIPGTLRVGDGSGALGSAVVKFIQTLEIANASNITVFSDGTLDLNNFSNTISTLTVNNGSVSIGTGSLALNGALNMTGGSIASTTGTLSLGGTVTATSSALSSASITSKISLNGARTFNVAAGSISPALLVSGLLQDGNTASSLTKTGLGTMNLTGNASNTYTGLTTIDQGVVLISTSVGFVIPGNVVIGNAADPAGTAVLRESNSNDFATTTVMTINPSGIFDLNSFSDTIGALNGTGSLALGSGLLVIGKDNSSQTYGGVIGGTGGIVKQGTGTQTFTANNTYTGTTTIQVGALLINGSQPGSAVNVATGGTLGGTGTVGTTQVFASKIAPGVNGVGQLSTGNLTLDATSSLLLDITSAGFDSINVTGTVTLGSSALTLTIDPSFIGTSTPMVLINNDAADAISGVFSNFTEKQTVTLGALSGTFSYLGGTGNDVTLTVTNVAPVLTSSIIATPSAPFAGQTITFSAPATDANGDVLTYAWTFGDGATSTAAAPTHVYPLPGTYTVAVTISDPFGGTATGSIMLTVIAPLVGTGIDSDGDGFSDAFETTAGTNPNDATATPTGSPATSASLLPLAITKASIKLNFAKAKSDAIAFSGTLPVAAGFKVSGATVLLDINGITRAFKLDAKGGSKTGSDLFKIAIKATKGLVATQTAKFAVQLKSGSFAAALAPAGLVGTSTVKAKPVSVLFTVVFNRGIYQKSQAMAYTAKQGKTGAAK